MTTTLSQELLQQLAKDERVAELALLSEPGQDLADRRSLPKEFLDYEASRVAARHVTTLEFFDDRQPVVDLLTRTFGDDVLRYLVSEFDYAHAMGCYPVEHDEKLTWLYNQLYNYGLTELSALTRRIPPERAIGTADRVLVTLDADEKAATPVRCEVGAHEAEADGLRPIAALHQLVGRRGTATESSRRIQVGDRLIVYATSNLGLSRHEQLQRAPPDKDAKPVLATNLHRLCTALRPRLPVVDSAPTPRARLIVASLLAAHPFTADLFDATVECIQQGCTRTATRPAHPTTAGAKRRKRRSTTTASDAMETTTSGGGGSAAMVTSPPQRTSSSRKLMLQHLRDTTDWWHKYTAQELADYLNARFPTVKPANKQTIYDWKKDESIDGSKLRDGRIVRFDAEAAAAAAAAPPS